MTSPETDPFRERLLNAQPMTPGLREEYQRELDLALNHRLTPATRLATWGGIVACGVFVALCVRSLVLYHAESKQLWITLPTFIAVAVALAGFARRTMGNVIEGLGATFVGVFVAVSLLSGIGKPSDPASTYSAVWGLALLVVGFAWSTGNRMSAAELRTREQMLRLESRLADLAERVGKP